jgi:hypothetical protein
MGTTKAGKINTIRGGETKLPLPVSKFMTSMHRRLPVLLFFSEHRSSFGIVEGRYIYSISCYAQDLTLFRKRRFYTTDPSAGNNKGKRKSRSKDAVSTEPRRKSKRKRRERQDMEVDQEVVSAEEVTDAGGNEEPGSSSTRGLSEGPDTPSLPVTNDAMDLEPEEEEKPKPRLRLTYEGLRLNSQCLCVVVEPIQKKVNDERGPPSVAANEPERQPLFLSEEDHDEEEDQPSGVEGDMMTFSQRLHAMVDYTTGVVDDGEDTEGDVFLGDADDAREF